jgi:hypothetical protein
MSDEHPADNWSILEPTSSQRHRIEQKVSEWLEANDTSIAAEWLGLIRVQPLACFGYAAAGALSLLFFSPIGLLIASLL